MKPFDTIIVGGGPAGGTVGTILARKGYSVAIIEEHKEIGLPLSCAGLVTSRIFNYTTLPSAQLIQNSIYGAIIHAPLGKTITIGGDKIHALTINRTLLDKHIIATAEENSAEILLHSKVTTIQQKNKTVDITFLHEKRKEHLKTKLLIGADGPYSLVQKNFNFPQPQEMLKAIGAEITDTSLDPRFVHIYLGQNIAPGFFAWIIPINTQGTQARIGLCTNKTTPKPLQYYFDQLLQQKEIQDIEILHRTGGVIPLGALKKTTTDHIMLVGDSAAQVKPTSGGGIYPGLLCAQHCATTAVHALEENDYSQTMLKKYHTAWTQDIGRELFMGMQFRRIYKKLTDRQFNHLLEKISLQKNIEIINDHGDIDYPSKLALPLIKKMPSLLKYLPQALLKKKENSPR